MDVPDAKRRQVEGGQARQVESDQVRQHYNAVPEHDRKWRGTESKIKGLRSFNNWVKSAIIQKFSANEDFSREQAQGGGRYYDRNRHNAPQNEQGILVLDVGCGKGGDLEKWKNAPQKVDLYVGIDPADVSVDQARGRYSSMPRFGARASPLRRPLPGQGLLPPPWLGEIPIVQKVGIDPSVGPDGFNPLVPNPGGFDVVTMMFVLHYAFESEEKARMMLRNVAGSLKPGGRFLGAIPNSDVLSSRIRNHSDITGKENSSYKGVSDYPPEVQTKAPAAQAGGDALNYDDDAGGQAQDQEPSDDEWDPEKPSDPQQKPAADSDSDSDWDPEKPSEPQAGTAKPGGSPPAKPPVSSDTNDETDKTDKDTTTPVPLTFGNSIYEISFADRGPLPRDGVFRPSFGWKYTFDLKEAVTGVPEYVVPWEAFRALALEYDLELRYKKGFGEVWREEKGTRELRELAGRMGVLDRETGGFRVGKEEWEATGMFCFFSSFSSFRDVEIEKLTRPITPGI